MRYSFEISSSFKRREQNRLLKKLRNTINEFTMTIGQQVVVLMGTPGKSNSSYYQVFGASPLEGVIENLKATIMQKLENALVDQPNSPPPIQKNPTLFDLPSLIINGVPTPVEKMTQYQLRFFLPYVLKYSNEGRKPGWGLESTKPPWWPKEVPWANIRTDVRSKDEKQKLSWTDALRKAIINCYKFYGREDLLPKFPEESEKTNIAYTSNKNERMLPPHSRKFRKNCGSLYSQNQQKEVLKNRLKISLTESTLDSDLPIKTDMIGDF
ncbi:hypothetical protein ABEB36_011109 [Hypothenemus hampei]